MMRPAMMRPAMMVRKRDTSEITLGILAMQMNDFIQDYILG
jgi:hypothetical protein